MPSTGTFRSNTFGSHFGAFGSYTLDGPPEKMMPFGFNSLTRSAGMSWRTTWQKTFSSRTRRAMSCPNWAPKSKIRTSSSVMGGKPRFAADQKADKRRSAMNTFQKPPGGGFEMNLSSADLPSHLPFHLRLILLP